MALPAKKRLSYTDYLRLEQETGIRHEFLDGEVVAMAGGTLRHSRLKTNLTVDVSVALGDGPCQAYDADAKIRIAESGLSTYPDLSVICGDPVRDGMDKHAANNPTALFEVLGTGTEAWDRGGKRLHYRKLESLQEYVLVDHREPRVEVYTRTGPDVWEHRVFEAGQQARLTSIGIALSVDRLYRNLPPPPENDAG